MSNESILLSPCTNRTQRLNAYERIKQVERKQGALEELLEFDDVLEELHMDIYGHDWTKKEILEYIVRLKNKNEKRIKELEDKEGVLKDE